MKNGFTLLEVLIALLAAALISIMSFDFLSNTVFLKERIDKSIVNDSIIEDLEMSCFTGSYVTGTVSQEYLNWVENEYKS